LLAIKLGKDVKVGFEAGSMASAKREKDATLRTYEGEGVIRAGTFIGRGKLSPGDFAVQYELTRAAITRPKTSQHPSFVNWSSTIKVQRVDGQPIPEGIYELTLEDGTIERVKNHGPECSVLSPLPR
jgi:hypothetical protein